MSDTHFGQVGQSVENQTNIGTVVYHAGDAAPKRKGWSIPPPSAYSTGQEAYLQRVAEILEAGGRGGITQPTGLRGFGGVGKTELALAYAQLEGEKYQAGHFVVAESLAALDFGLAQIADPDLPKDATGQSIQALRDQALRDLAGIERALVVFDNVDEIVQTAEFKEVLAALPRAHVLLTCRHGDMGAHIRQIEVAKMDERTGALYVLRLGLGEEAGGPWSWEAFREKDREDATLITGLLDGLPLALHHAGGAIRAESLSVGEALEDYRSNRTRILNNRGQGAEATHPASAQLTVMRALERLRAKDAAAAELVVCCAFLAPEAISESLFTEGMVRASEPLASELGRFAAIRRVALASALVERVPVEGRLGIHRVTQAVLQDAEGAGAVARLGRITNRAVITLHGAGRYREAIVHAEFEAAERARLLGPRHPDALRSVNNLATTLLSMGWHTDALRLQEGTLAIFHETLGERHPDTLANMNNLASTYWWMGRHEDALALYEQTLALQRETLGEGHPNTLANMNNIASTYGSMGRHADALELKEETLARHREALGPSHPNTLLSMNNLASSYGDLGRHEDARKLHEETLALRREALGPRHPDTLMSMNNFASAYWSMGQHMEALALYELAAQGFESTLGLDHPTTRMVRENLLIAKRRVAQA